MGNTSTTLTLTMDGNNMAVQPDSARIKERLDYLSSKKEAKKEAAASSTLVNKLASERTPEGMWYVRWTEGGMLPDVLKSKFTSKQHMLNAVNSYYGNLEIME